MKTVLFQYFQEGRHLSWKVDKFLAKQKEDQKLATESDGSNSDDFEATAN